MSMPNGLQSPTTLSDAPTFAHTIGKRKRSLDLNDAKHANGDTNTNQVSEGWKGQFGALLLDIFEVLKRFVANQSLELSIA